MKPFAFHFFGGFRISIEAEPVENFHSDKARALLAYLALEPQQHSRRALAALLWPDIGDRYALTNLRNTLHRLRQTLDRAAPEAALALLNITRHTVQFKRESAFVDVLRFQKLLDEEPASSQPKQLSEAVALYRGELLAGFGLSDAPPFEEWLLLRRELLHQQALVALRDLSSLRESAGDSEGALAAVTRLLALDPLSEDGYRQSMHLLTRMGLPDRALHQFEHLRRLLRDELGVEPSPALLTLARQIAAGESLEAPVVDEREAQKRLDAAPSPPDPAPSLSQTDLDLSEVPQPGPFFGRRKERQQIVKWLLHDRCRVVAILGIGGMGKTSLAAQCARELVTTNGSLLHNVLWRSLLNAPPLEELLPSLLQILSDQGRTAASIEPSQSMPKSLDELLRLFLLCLRDWRVLFVLDNVESILSPDRAGTFRTGYEPYGQLIQRVATQEHQSHLLLTSRERPRGYARLEGDSPLVRSLQIEGLDVDAGRELLALRGLSGLDEEESLLVGRYSGNPLALKLVADTVDEIFGGDIREFLAEETLVFDDIRAVLDQHFARLSELEREILFWLAVERVATPASQLRDNLVKRPTQPAILEALRNLQRRSLIERRESGFALQNVVTEYLSDLLIEAASQEFTTGAIDLLHRHALLKAQAKEYIRQSQTRVILEHVGERLVTRFGKAGLTERLRELLNQLRMRNSNAPSYAGANILNLALLLQIDLTGFDFSRLSIRQAYLRGAALPDVDFAGADLAGCTFTQTFTRIEAVAISPDGQWLASGGDGGEVRLFYLADARPHLLLSGHTNTITTLKFGPEGTRLASSGDDGTIRLWEIESGRTICRLACDAPVRVLAFSPDGRLLASGCRNGTVQLWEVSRELRVATLLWHNQRVNALAFHPSGEVLASAASDGAINLWNVNDVCAPAQGVLTDEKDANGLRQNSTPLKTVINDPEIDFYSALFSHSGALLVAGSGDGIIRIWDGKGDRLIRTFEDQDAEIRALVFRSDDAYLFSANYHGTIRLWDTTQMRCVYTMTAHEENVYALALSPDNRTMASGSEDGTIGIWDVTTPDQSVLVQRLHGYPKALSCVAWCPSGRWLASGDVRGTVRLWDLLQPVPTCTQALSGESQVVSVDFSPTGEQLILCRYGQQQGTQLWRLGSDDRWHEQRVHAIQTSGVAAFSPRGTVIASCEESGEIYLWNAATLDRYDLHLLGRHDDYVKRLAFGASLEDGDELLATCSDDQTVRIWDLSVGEEIRRLPMRGNKPCVDINRNCGLLACAGPDFTVALWSLADVEQEQPVRQLQGHANEIFSCAFSPDGRQMVTGSLDRSVRLWDTGTGELLTLLGHHDQYALDVAFSPDGKMVASAGKGGSVRVWHLQSGACRSVLRAPGPYEGMNISGVTGITEAQRDALKALGAVEDEA